MAVRNFLLALLTLGAVASLQLALPAATAAPVPREPVQSEPLVERVQGQVLRDTCFRCKSDCRRKLQVCLSVFPGYGGTTGYAHRQRCRKNERGCVLGCDKLWCYPNRRPLIPPPHMR